MLERVKVFLAGGLAEDEVFGEDDATTGRSHDREMATQILVDHVRRYGFDPAFQSNYAMDGPYYLERKITDEPVETLMRRLVAETRALLAADRPMLLALARRLQQAGGLDAPAIASIAADFGLRVELRAEGERIAPHYADRLAEA
jgi:cell division protease FtsH